MRRTTDVKPFRMASEVGAVAGAEGLLFGIVIAVVATLAVVNLWSIVEAHNMADTAATAYLRAYTEADSAEQADATGQSAAHHAFTATGWRADRLHLRGADASRFGPCQVADVLVRVRVPAIRIPLGDGWGERTVSVHRRELVDPYRQVLSGPAYDAAATPC